MEELIKRKIYEADAIVIAAPCFALAAPAVLKTVMDRCTAWVLDIIAKGEKPKFGAAIMVGGADQKWVSLQRVFPAEFLKIFNCQTVGMFTVTDTGLKKEVLLSGSNLKRANGLGMALVKSIESDSLVNYTYSESRNMLICPNCFSDVFHVNKDHTKSCAVCNTKIKKYKKLEKLLKRSSKLQKDNIFTPKGTRDHNNYIGDKISRLMDATDEVNSRSKLYFDEDKVPIEDYNVMKKSDKKEIINIVWNEEGLKSLDSTVPNAFKSFVKKAIEKKAQDKGYKAITKEIFLEIKKESGN